MTKISKSQKKQKLTKRTSASKLNFNLLTDEVFKENLELSIKNFHKPIIRSTFDSSALIKHLESMSLEHFNALSKENQAKILMSYSRVKCIVETKASKYYKTNGHNVRLEKPNFDGILLETITKVLNKIEESNSRKLSKQDRKMKSNKDEVFEFKTTKDIFGYLTNAYVQNVKKNYVPEKTKKRTALSIISSSISTTSSSSLHDQNKNKIDSYGSVNAITDYENKKTIKLIHKTLKKYDHIKLDSKTLNPADFFDLLLANPNHADIARNLDIPPYILNKYIMNLSNILENEGLLENLKETLCSIIDESSSDKSFLISDNFFSNNKIEFSPPCINQNFKNKKIEVIIKAYTIIDNKKTEIPEKSICESFDINSNLDDIKIKANIIYKQCQAVA